MHGTVGAAKHRKRCHETGSIPIAMHVKQQDIKPPQQPSCASTVDQQILGRRAYTCMGEKYQVSAVHTISPCHLHHKDGRNGCQRCGTLALPHVGHTSSPSHPPCPTASRPYDQQLLGRATLCAHVHGGMGKKYQVRAVHTAFILPLASQGSCNIFSLPPQKNCPRCTWDSCKGQLRHAHIHPTPPPLLTTAQQTKCIPDKREGEGMLGGSRTVKQSDTRTTTVVRLPGTLQSIDLLEQCFQGREALWQQVPCSSCSTPSAPGGHIQINNIVLVNS